jgi:hypothetical protein
MKSITLLLLFISTVNLIVAQNLTQKTGTDCSFKKELYGLWVIENIVEDLSGENLETEGQSWKLSTTDNSNIKGKITMTFSPDGSFIGKLNVSDSTSASYGYWRTSEDCKQLIVTTEGIEDQIEIFSIEMQYLVLKMEDEFKMIFRKLKL